MAATALCMFPAAPPAPPPTPADVRSRTPARIPSRTPLAAARLAPLATPRGAPRGNSLGTPLGAPLGAPPGTPSGAASTAASPTPIAATRLAAPVASGRDGKPLQPFATAEEAWFWTMAALMARREGARYVANQGRVQRPCEPDDVVKCLDTLYRRRRIDLVHARIMRIWGERQAAPNPAHPNERSDWRLWREAMDRLEWPLRVKGIVA